MYRSVDSWCKYGLSNNSYANDSRVDFAKSLGKGLLYHRDLTINNLLQHGLNISEDQKIIGYGSIPEKLKPVVGTLLDKLALINYATEQLNNKVEPSDNKIINLDDLRDIPQGGVDDVLEIDDAISA